MKAPRDSPLADRRPGCGARGVQAAGRQLLLALVLGATALAGCGGDGDAEEDPAARAAVKRAIDTTIAGRTAAFAIVVGPPIDTRYDGAVDFSTKTGRFVIPGTAGKPGLEILSQDGSSYFRAEGDERYQEAPAESENPVADNPADSLPFLERDAVGFTSSGERQEGGVAVTCYDASFDAERVRERVVDGREGQFDRAADALDGAPLEICVGPRDLLHSFVVTLETDDQELASTVILTEHGTTPPLARLSADELPE